MKQSAFSRRTLLAALPGSLLGSRLLAQSSPALRIEKINCFEIAVADVQRTVDFYQKLFGMPVQSRHGGRVCLRVGAGPAFMAVRRVESGEAPSIVHLGYSVQNFDLVTVQSVLQQQGFSRIEAPPLVQPGIAHPRRCWVRMRDGTPELYLSDDRGLIVQLSDGSYCGGSGELGSVCPAPEQAPAGLFQLQEINHFTAFVNDGAGANTFYQQFFGLEVQAYQGANSPVTGIGDGKQFVMYAGGVQADRAVPASLNHGCFNMPGFDVEAILATLTANGLSARPEGQRTAGPLMHYVSRRQPERGGAVGGTPELYFTDPDGLLMQLQDLSYCGGGGYLGNECLAKAAGAA